MKISITDSLEIQTLDIDQNIKFGDLKALIEVDLKIPVARQQCFLNGNLLQGDSKTLKELGITPDDIILVQATQSKAEQARLHILSDPTLRQQFTQRNPQIEQALNNPAMFERLYEEMQRQARALQEQEQSLAFSDPFDVEAQKKIEEQIRKEIIHKNYETALEHNPEFFGRVVMLYINVEVNGQPVKAFVDSGAQASIMSPECAERCNVMKILDERFQGIATGVGTAKILGRIHSTQIKVGSQFLPISLSVMEGKDVDLLFGLDVLKRHQAIIDLQKNCLRIHGEEIPFLAEHELPEKARQKVVPSSQEPAPAASSATTTSAPIPQQGPSVTPGQNSNAPKYSETVIKNLTDLGVSRAEAIAALDACGGNPDMAANLIFQ